MNERGVKGVILSALLVLIVLSLVLKILLDKQLSLMLTILNNTILIIDNTFFF